MQLSRVFVLVVRLIAVVMVAGVVALLYSIVNGHLSLNQTNSTLRNQHVEVTSATSGLLFQGVKFRQYQKKTPNSDRSIRHSKEAISNTLPRCDRWAVVTTIFEPSDAVKTVAQVPGWCLVVVGDAKGPNGYNISTTAADSHVVFLDASSQVELASLLPFVDELPWNHFGRKNVGYLYAIMHGARVVWDFDDDNLLLENSIFDMITSAYTNTLYQNATVDVYEYENPDLSFRHRFNPYPVMGAPSLPSWPRGLPLSYVKVTNDGEGLQKGNLRTEKLRLSDVAVIQSLANHDPDVDAIYRLTQPLPFSFHFPQHVVQSGSILSTNAILSTQQFVAVPIDAFTPYNAQATLHTYDALWGLYLPITVHGRVSDIWRAYIFQAVIRGTGLRVLFSTPSVVQHRNAHNYLADLQSESDLYHKTERLLEQLESDTWTLRGVSIAERLVELYIHMYEHGYVEEKDVEMTTLWVQALTDAGYRFPDHRLPTARK